MDSKGASLPLPNFSFSQFQLHTNIPSMFGGVGTIQMQNGGEAGGSVLPGEQPNVSKLQKSNTNTVICPFFFPGRTIPLWTIIKKELETNKLEVINLSQYQLSSDEKSVLELGLSFCPTQKGNKFELAKDVMLFARKLLFHIIHDTTVTPQVQKAWDMELWKDFTINDFWALKDLMQFWEESNTAEPIVSVILPMETSNTKLEVIPEYKNKSQSFPPLQCNIHIWSFVQKKFHDIRSLPDLPTASNNLTQFQHTALQNLTKNYSIIIKPSDKGGNMVIMDRPKYIKMCMDIINNKEWKQKLKCFIRNSER